MWCIIFFIFKCAKILEKIFQIAQFFQNKNFSTHKKWELFRSFLCMKMRKYEKLSAFRASRGRNLILMRNCTVPRIR